MNPTVHDIKASLAAHAITHVLLDMDGTLLDKYFDDYFWEHLVPEKYADKHASPSARQKRSSSQSTNPTKRP